MGGRSDQIDLYILVEAGTGDDAEVLFRELQQFRVENARCFLESDTERLLAMVEAGFGSFKEFNIAVRNVLSTVVPKELHDFGRV